MWREGRQDTGEKCYNRYFDLSQVFFLISDKYMSRCRSKVEKKVLEDV